MRAGVLAELSSASSAVVADTPETGEVLAVRELGPLLSSDERFGALHDLMGLHTETTDEGFAVRLCELWSPDSEDEMAMGIVLSLSLGRQVLGVWDLGLSVESVEAVECYGKGRLQVVVVPKMTGLGDDEEPETNIIDIAYVMDGPEASALRVRFGKQSKIVPKSGRRRDLFLQRVLRVFEVEVEREDVVHARVFEVDARGDLPGVEVLLQISDASGKIRTFDVGMHVRALTSVTCVDDRDLVIAGRDVETDTPVTATVRALGSRAVPERIAIAKG